MFLFLSLIGSIKSLLGADFTNRTTLNGNNGILSKGCSTGILLLLKKGQEVQRLGYGSDDRGSIPGRVNDGTFSLPGSAGPPSLLTNGHRAFTPEVKQQGCEADHSLPRLGTRGAIYPLHYMSSWRGTYKSSRRGT
jgi:hypothetical protein